MEKKYEDPFISILKNNLKSSDTYSIPIPQNDINIKNNFNELINEEELGKKIGKMEAILNYYEAKLNNEFNERKMLERRYEEKIDSLTSDINDIKLNFENFSKLFTENFSKIKANILENVDNKNNALNKIVYESAKRINTLEDIILNSNNLNNNNNNNINPQKSMINNDNITSKSANNSIFFSTTERDSSFMKQNYTSLYNGKFDILNKKVNQLESLVSKKGNYPGREEEINTGLAKINHMEKKFELFLENYSKDTNIIKNTLRQNINNLEQLATSYDVLNEKYDNLYKNFNDTNINNNKFNYQTTILLNETQKKMEEYTDYFNNTKIELNKIENDLNNEYSLLKEVITEKIEEFNKNIKEFENNVTVENTEFKKNMEEKQDKFINYIQSENMNYMHDAKNVQNQIEGQCSNIKRENMEINKNINEIKNSFFHNLNEIEQYFNRKYQSLCRAINLKET